MTEEQVVIEQPKQETQVAATPNPFAQNSWVDTIEQPAVPTEQKVETKTEIPAVVEEDEILEPSAYLKTKWGWENEEAADNEIKELREFKTKGQTPPEYKFENEESKKLADAIAKGDRKTVLNILQTQENLERYTASEVTKDNAADIIKMNMQLKYPTLTQSQIEFQYRQEYGVPKEPIYNDQKETEDEFKERHEQWKEQVSNIEMKTTIAATMAKPELEKAKSQLVLPEINKPVEQPANQPDPAAIKAIRDNFLAKLESDFNKVEGFSTKVKDESVEFPVQFKIPDEDKVAIKGRLQDGFDVNEYMDKRWFDDKGNARIEQIEADIYLLENLEKVLSGVANNAASERLKAQMKSAANIDLNGQTPQQTFQQNGNGKQISPFAKEAWSDKPPVINN